MSRAQDPGHAGRFCFVCGKASPAVPPDREGHEACIEAYGLDQSPLSDAEARTWLDDRRHRMGELPRWTERAYAPVYVGDGTYALALAEKNRPGYLRSKERFASYEAANLAADDRNRCLFKQAGSAGGFQNRAVEHACKAPAAMIRLPTA